MDIILFERVYQKESSWIGWKGGLNEAKEACSWVG